MNFAEFKASSPARSMFRKMGLLDYLEAATSWNALQALIVQFNNPDEGNFVKLARECDGVASSGERILLHAILLATDFAWLADELANGEAWQRMYRVSGDFQRAVAACIQRSDGRAS